MIFGLRPNDIFRFAHMCRKGLIDSLREWERRKNEFLFCQSEFTRFACSELLLRNMIN